MGGGRQSSGARFHWTAAGPFDERTGKLVAWGGGRGRTIARLAHYASPHEAPNILAIKRAAGGSLFWTNCRYRRSYGARGITQARLGT